MKLLEETLAGIEPADSACREEARRYIDTLTMPRGRSAGCSTWPKSSPP